VAGSRKVTLAQPSAMAFGSTIEWMARRHPVVLLPGAVLPAGPAYASLLEVLGGQVDALTKDLEVCGGSTTAGL
jgi:hypothetical protein